VPIDHVVRAAHAIARDPRAPGRTFHIVDPHPLPARRVFELVAQKCDRPMPRGTFPTNLARALLGAPGLARFAKSPRAFVSQLTTDVRFDANNTLSLLAGTGITCPAFDSYVGALVGYVKARVRERKVVLG
jgi:nucleoside-diphosphate-sugar epimerase